MLRCVKNYITIAEISNVEEKEVKRMSRNRGDIRKAKYEENTFGFLYRTNWGEGSRR